MPCKFTPLEIPEVILVEPRIFADDRGFFMETYKKSEFVANGIDAEFVQNNHSKSCYGVTRGLHFQVAPYAQGKLVRVTEGKVWDVAVDIRKDSPTYGQWCGAELSAENGAMLWIPPGFAHGFVTLSETAHFLYKCTNEYHGPSERAIRWDDPTLNIDWKIPAEDAILSDKDIIAPLFSEV